MAEKELPILPGPEAVKVFRILMFLTFVCATVVFIGIITAVFRSENTRMGAYRWYILHGVGWSFALDLIMIVWMPMQLFPLACLTGAGLLSGASDSHQRLAGVLMQIAGHGKSFSLFAAMTFRYAKALPQDGYKTLRYLVRPNVFVHLVLLLAGQATIIIPVVLTSDMAGVKEELAKVYGPHAIFQPSSPYVCLRTADAEGRAGLLALYTTMSVMLFFLMFSTSAMLMHLKTLMRHQTSKGTFTFRLHLMLYESIRMQLACGAIMFMIPLAASVYVLATSSHNGPHIMMLTVWVTSTHSIFDGLAIIAYVRPYRVYLLGLAKEAIYKLRGLETPPKRVLTSQLHLSSSRTLKAVR